jgi:DNA repair protein RadA/Sms
MSAPALKTKTAYRCTECGAVHPKWHGQCPDCGVWDTFMEDEIAGGSQGAGRKKAKSLEFIPLDGANPVPPRFSSGIGELDRALGGGIVPGSAVLIGGQPGIGKSTLLSKVLSATAAPDAPVVYVSGEESAEQVRMRFRRLKLETAHVKFLAAAELERILSAVDGLKDVRLLVMDSIQTVFSERIPSAPGTVAQVRTAAHELARYCKKRNISLILVGHVTKEGQIAGPKLLEHMVDTVLYFEGEDRSHFRMIRATKNRFGAANEVGFFDMQPDGLKEVRNPSGLFLPSGSGSVSGSAVCAAMEGTRPMLLEVQALAAKTNMATPRRAVVGWDPNRLAMLLAVLQVRCGTFLGDREIYLNVAGGVRIAETAADAAAAAALLSSYCDRPLPPHSAVFGEVGLSGEIRMTGHTAVRIREAANMGFTRVICPRLPDSFRKESTDVNCLEVSHVRDLSALICGA